MKRTLTPARTRGKPGPSVTKDAAVRCKKISVGIVRDRRLALVAHELRNPLSSIQASLKILEMKPSEELACKARSLMHRQLSHLSRLINDLVDTSRIRSGKLRLRISSVEIHDVINFALQICGEVITEAGLIVETSIPSDTPLIDGDADRLGQAAANLIQNAVKFSHEKGKISLLVTHDDAEIRLSVTDNGIGLTKQQLNTLFKPFVQVGSAQERSPNGLGLGLYITKSIIEEHGGRIEVYSPGLCQGATFVLILAIKGGVP